MSNNNNNSPDPEEKSVSNSDQAKEREIQNIKNAAQILKETANETKNPLLRFMMKAVSRFMEKNPETTYKIGK